MKLKKTTSAHCTGHVFKLSLVAMSLATELQASKQALEFHSPRPTTRTPHKLKEGRLLLGLTNPFHSLRRKRCVGAVELVAESLRTSSVSRLRANAFKSQDGDLLAHRCDESESVRIEGDGETSN